MTLSCLLCRSHEGKNIYRYILARKVFNVVVCRDCGFMYTSPQPDAGTLQSIYPENYYSYVEYTDMPFLSEHPQGISGRIKNVLKRQILTKCYGYPVDHDAGYWHLLPKGMLDFLRYYFVIFPEHIHNGSLLDVGCGSGQYIYVLKQLGWQVQGLEINEQAVAYARQRGVDVTQGDTLMGAGFQDNSFDIVRFNHTIEHFPDPIGELTEARRILRPGGIIMVTVPNVRSLEMDIFGKYWWQINIPEHLYHFSEKHLKTLLNHAGFSVYKRKYLAHAEILASIKNLVAQHKGKGSFAMKLLSNPVFETADKLMQIPLGYILALFKKSNTLSVYGKK